MADRLFAGVILLLAAAYTYIAFMLIKAPFQYDPLGPESWPRLLGVLAIVVSAFILLKPDVHAFGLHRDTAVRLSALLIMLIVYAALFQPLGFIISTALFCIALSLMLGAKPAQAVIFGICTGAGGYLLCTTLLELNLPAGILKSLL